MVLMLSSVHWPSTWNMILDVVLIGIPLLTVIFKIAVPSPLFDGNVKPSPALV